jgi:hypothetical protein
MKAGPGEQFVLRVSAPSAPRARCPAASCTSPAIRRADAPAAVHPAREREEGWIEILYKIVGPGCAR